MASSRHFVIDRPAHWMRGSGEEGRIESRLPGQVAEWLKALPC